MPDALSKTIPIWCSVLNHVLFPSLPPSQTLFTPPSAVSASEHAQIAARIPSFVASFGRLALDVPPLSKPLRPVWVTPGTGLPDSSSGDGDGDGVVFEGFHPVVCCTTSRRADDGAEAAGYVQGAADDTENWAEGLTAALFWANEAELLALPEADARGRVRELVAAEGARGGGGGGPATRLGRGLYVGKVGGIVGSPPGTVCEVVITQETAKPETWAKSPRRMEVGVGKHKTASRNLRDALPVVCEFVGRYLNAAVPEGEEGAEPPEEPPEERCVLVTCESGRDLSVGVALALSCRCFDADGEVRRSEEQEDRFTKDAIRIRLGKIMTAMPGANPSRATLQSVNSFLMDWRS
jgi:tRNA A64-2'-O-ribosylphosphate transferase